MRHLVYACINIWTSVLNYWESNAYDKFVGCAKIALA